MKNNRGFIATSLIYSFFLVFIAIIAALLSNYLANKNILERYGETVAEDLNSEKYNLSVYLKDSEVVGGTFFTNLLNYGENGNSQAYWKCDNSNCSTNSNNNKITFTSNSTVKQSSIYFENNSKYYYEIDYDYKSFFPIFKIGNSKISDYYTDEINKKLFGIYNYDATSQYLDVSIQNSSGGSRFYNIRILKISDKYDNEDWIKNNIEWFYGTVSYYIKKHISDDTITFKLITRNAEMLNKINCDNATISSKIKENGNNYYTVTLSNITGDVVCKDY